MSDLQVGLQAAVAVMVFGSLLMLLVIYFVRTRWLAPSPAWRRFARKMNWHAHAARRTT